MKIDQLVPQLTLRQRFTLRYRKFIPKTPGCYALATADDELLYGGLTVNLHSRFAQHRDCKEKCEATPQGVAFWFYYLECEPKQLRKIERTWLNIHELCHGIRPVPNKVDSPVR